MSSNKWMHERQSSVTHRVPCCSVPVTNCPSLLQSTEDGQRASSQSPVLWLLRGAACHHGAGRALMSDAQNKLQRHTVNACPRNKKTDPRNDTLQLLSSPWDVFYRHRGCSTLPTLPHMQYSTRGFALREWSDMTGAVVVPLLCGCSSLIKESGCINRKVPLRVQCNMWCIWTGRDINHHTFLRVKCFIMFVANKL